MKFFEITDHIFNLDALGQTSKLLQTNPEYYTIWNHRRLILQHLFGEDKVGQELEDGHSRNVSLIAELISDDLNFLLPLLRQFPKCYWIWKYRQWLLDEATRLLPVSDARGYWQRELGLVGKMLSLDSRNFHGWGYRRKVVTALENAQLCQNGEGISMTEEDFQYTTKKIESNLSNFSAWHTRSKLIPRLLDERKADEGARKDFLDSGKSRSSDLNTRLILG